MNSDYETKKLWVDKVAFLGLFIAALLIARFIVVLRSSVKLSEPIELAYGCLSVSIPTGNGWQGAESWEYQGEAFTLDSSLSVGTDSASSLVSCRYELAPVAAASQILFEEKAYAAGGSIAKSGEIKVEHPSEREEGFAIEWVHINNREIPFDIFFGVVQLPGNRRLSIEVYQSAGDTYFAEELFKSVAGSLEFTDNHLLEKGMEVVEEIKRKGLNSFLGPRFSGTHGRETFFLIKEAGGSLIGFTMEVLSSRFSPKPEETTEAQLNILAGTFYYIRQRRYDHRQAALFQSDNNFNEFLWKIETYGPSSKSGVEMLLGKDGILAVKKFERRLQKGHFQIGSAAVPDILSDLVFIQMFESGRTEIFVDIIGADGRIIPTRISRTGKPDPAENRRRSDGPAFIEEAACAFQVDFLDGRGFSEEMYLDYDGQVSGRILQQEKEYILEPTSEENILQQFPEHGRYILQRKEEVFNQNQFLGE